MRALLQNCFLNLVIRGAQSLYPTGVVAVSKTLRRPLGILLIPSESLADTLHALPVVRALRRAFPDTRISMMTRTASSDLVKDAPGLDEAILCYPLDHPWLRRVNFRLRMGIGFRKNATRPFQRTKFNSFIIEPIYSQRKRCFFPIFVLNDLLLLP